jgi:hypothetical protein
MLNRVGSAAQSVGRAIDRALLPACVRDDPEEARLLRPLTYAGMGLLTAVIIVTSCVEHARAAFTQDLAINYQAAYQIAHGNFDPADTFSGFQHFWQGHLELLYWVLAPLIAIFPNQLTLQLAQDAAGIASCVIAWRWMLTMLYRPGTKVPYRRTIALCSLAVLVLDPWIYWTYAFDVHSEAFAPAFLVASAYAFYLNRPLLGFLLALGVLVEGDATATYLAGFGLTILLVRYRQPWYGLGLIAAGFGAVQGMHALGSGRASGMNTNYGYLVYGVYTALDPRFPAMTIRDLLIFMVTHPLTVLYVFKDKAIEVYANTAPLGFIGILSPWAIGIALLMLIENQLAFALAYAQPIFQNMPLYIFGTVGFTWVLAKFASQGFGRPAAAFAILASLNTLGWAVVWLPQLYPHWIRTSAATAAVISRVENEMDPSDQVVTTQGIIGVFAGHREASSLWFGDRPVPWRGERIDFVLVPYEGINVEPVNRSLAAIDSLIHRYHADIRLYDRGVWWLTVTGTPGGQLNLPAGADDVPAWACTGPAGVTDLFGTPAQWNSYAKNSRGYVVARAYWRERFGNFRASADLVTSSPAILEVWDQTSNETIVRKPIVPGPRRRVSVDFRHLDRGTPKMYTGAGPFVIEPVEPAVHDILEVRVYTEGRGVIRVYRVGLKPLTQVN